ncbi:MAG: ribose 5-phosphate isomerase B [Acidobacteriota bacterium]|nr:ribose 5-phosphate isomerase B [Acidobacteriota bacterium]
MKVVLGSDHAGVELKHDLLGYLQQIGYETMNVGTDRSEPPVDYPDYAEKVAHTIREGNATRGILICGSGVGASVAANKIPGIRAGLTHDVYSAHQGVEHDDMNVMVLGSRVIGTQTARELAHAYLAARFTGEERHLRRLEKINRLEAKCKEYEATK